MYPTLLSLLEMYPTLLSLLEMYPTLPSLMVTYPTASVLRTLRTMPPRSVVTMSLLPGLQTPQPLRFGLATARPLLLTYLVILRTLVTSPQPRIPLEVIPASLRSRLQLPSTL